MPGRGRFRGRGEAAGVGLGLGVGVTAVDPGAGGGGGATGTAGVPVTEFDATDAPVELTAFSEIGYAVPFTNSVTPSDSVVIRIEVLVLVGFNAKKVVPSVEY